MTQAFFFDGQIRRYLLQFTRMLSNFQVEYGLDDDGHPTYLTVPVRYGNASRQAQTIIQQNSANGLPAAPLMTFYISNMKYARDRVQEPYHVSKMHVRQRKYLPEEDDWETTQGNAFTVERQMPVPYNMEISLDIWVTNEMQRHQIFEQLVVLFNPSFEIQSTDNFIDWTSLSVVELMDNNWTSRTIPIGADESIDITTFRFNVPIWIASPARVKKLGVITKIIAGIYDAKGDAVNAITNNDLLLGTRMQITPYGYQILLVGNQMQALKTNARAPTSAGSLGPIDFHPDPVDWKAVIEMYGVLRDGVSVIRLFDDQNNIEISGTVAYHPTDPKILLFTVDEDTIPANTLSPVTAVVDPERSGPGEGLPVATDGQRYLLVGDIGSNQNAVPSAAWGNVVAKTNDIIEFTDNEWVVSFNANSATSTHYVTNITTGIQYRWTGEEWLKSFEGLYEGGMWTLVL